MIKNIIAYFQAVVITKGASKYPEKFVKGLDASDAAVEALAAIMPFVKFAALLVSMGAIGFLIWKLGVWSSVKAIAWTVILPCVILAALGLVSISTVKSLKQVISLGDDMALNVWNYYKARK